MNADVLKERYEALCAEPSDINEHLPTFVGAVEEVQAQRVIELGVRYGVSTIAWMYALQKTGGHLWAVDCSFPIPSGVGKYADVNLLDPQGALGVVPHWTFMLGYDTNEQILASLPDQADIIFIDTNHVYEETLAELALFLPRVRPGGRIFLHDTAIEVTGNATTPQPKFPVKTAIQEFCAKKELEWVNNPNCSGLGTIYVP